jgi:hypothetical protein
MFAYRPNANARGFSIGSRASRIGLLLALAVATPAVLYFVPRIPQPLAYHDFADQRTLFGIPNALNVLTNLPFFFVGVAGLLFIGRQPPYPAGRHFLSGAERWPWLIFFLGVTLTCVGSAWYFLVLWTVFFSAWFLLGLPWGPHDHLALAAGGVKPIASSMRRAGIAVGELACVLQRAPATLHHCCIESPPDT